MPFNLDVSDGEVELQYSTTNDGSTCVFTLMEKLEFSDNSAVREIFEEFKSSGCAKCSIDLSKLEFIDSAGLGLLVLIHEAVENDDKSVEFAGPTGQVKKMLEITNFANVIKIVP